MNARLSIGLVLALAALSASAAGAGEIAGRVVDGRGNPLPEAVVFVRDLPAGSELPDRPRTAVVDQIDKQFVPHVLPVVVGTEVRFPNRDQIHHHVYSFSRSKTFETPLYKGEEAPPVLFDRLGPVKLGCNIHDWMSAVVFVVPTPLFAVSDAAGAFRIAGVPEGRYEVAAWHEGLEGSGEEVVQLVEVGENTPAVAFALEASPRRMRTVGGR